MRQIRQALRLHLEAGLSHAQAGRALGLPKATVGKYARLARAAGVDWTVAQGLSDDELEARLFRPAVPRAARHLEPDYALIPMKVKLISRLPAAAPGETAVDPANASSKRMKPVPTSPTKGPAPTVALKSNCTGAACAGSRAAASASAAVARRMDAGFLVDPPEG